MGLRDRIPPKLRAAILAALAVGLCAAPLAVMLSDVGERVHHYESGEVVANENRIKYGEGADIFPRNGLISNEIDCLGTRDQRVCQFEKYALRKGGLDVGEDWGPPILDPPRYVQLRGQLYERTYTEMDSGDRVRFGHEPVDAQRVLGLVSVDAERVPPEVAEAARTGHASSREAVEVPETPVATDDGEYYRVSREYSERHPASEDWLTRLAALSPLVGVALLVGLWRRTRITVEFD